MVSRDKPVPLYVQIKQHILQDIESGDTKPGDVLPAEWELEKRFAVSRITVRRALNDLMSAGYLQRKPGFGTVVVQSKIRHDSGRIGGFHDDLVRQGFRVEADLLAYGIGAAPEAIAREMGLTADAEVLHARKLIRASGTPVVLGESYHHFGPDVKLSPEDVKSDSVFTLVRQRFGLRFPYAERSIEATLPSKEEADLLEIDPSTPTLRVELSVFDDRDRLTSRVNAVYRGDRYKYLHRITVD